MHSTILQRLSEAASLTEDRVREIQKLEAETGQATGFKRNGSLRIATASPRSVTAHSPTCTSSRTG